MKNILERFKNFKYKTLTLVSILLIGLGLSYIVPGSFLGNVLVGAFCLLILLGLFQYAVSVYNFFTRDDDIFGGVLFGIVGIVIFSLLTYLVFFFD